MLPDGDDADPRRARSRTRLLDAAAHLLSTGGVERLLPQVTPPLPSSVPLREQLIELLTRQATLFAEAPLHLTTLAWVSLGPTSSNSDDAGHTQSLRTRVVDQYRQPFDAVLQSPQARDELDDFDVELAMCQLVGPLAFARMTGLHTMSRHHCERIVDDFLTAHRRVRPGGQSVAARDSSPK